MSAPHSSFSQLVGGAISKNPHIARRKLRIETQDGRVVLQGTVRFYYQKQMAQEAVRQVDGVRSIDNELLVLA